MADRERLPDLAEDHLLVGDDPREPDGVDRHVGRPAGLGDHARGARGRAGRRVELLVVVELDDLHLRHVLRGLLAELHEQHGPDREVRRDEHLGAVRGLHRREVEAGGADHGVHARGDTRLDVAERDIRAGEIDDDVEVTEDVFERDAERRIDLRRDDHAVSGLDGLAHGEAHLPCGACDAHPDVGHDQPLKSLTALMIWSPVGSVPLIVRSL